MGRDTHNKTITLPLQVSHSPPTYTDLEDEDTQPPTPPARVGSDSDHEIPKDRVVQKKKIQTVSIKHASPTTRGKGKLDLLLDQRIIQLEEKLPEYEKFDRYLNEDNVLLNEHVAKLDKKVTKGKGKQSFLAKRVRKWYDEFQGAK